jgi:hypothetical protein
MLWIFDETIAEDGPWLLWADATFSLLRQHMATYSRGGIFATPVSGRASDHAERGSAHSSGNHRVDCHGRILPLLQAAICAANSASKNIRNKNVLPGRLQRTQAGSYQDWKEASILD